ncbi:hypothetical protein [Embleya scabrispora]|uniref:hypothetical protein n=1 Tax=Embleya scabrispora TaxID=159449 RepID=UPI00036310C6|nr:hypothetical protein [Embleya scabrispora]MYS80618.1 hypothetical protein [Streptomyces sp. SID5474]
MITVVGQALVDLGYANGRAPAAHPGGSPADVAVGLGRLGAPVRLITWDPDPTASAAGSVCLGARGNGWPG